MSSAAMIKRLQSHSARYIVLRNMANIPVSDFFNVTNNFEAQWN